MALKADLCSVMHAKMLPGKCLGFNHSASPIFSNLSFGNNAPTSLPSLSLGNLKQHCTSARRATKRIAAVKSSDVEIATTSKANKSGEPYTTKVVSVKTLVGTKGEIGEICHIVLDHGGSFSFIEGQYLGVILHPADDETQSRVVVSSFSIASCRNGDSFDGKTLSLCIRRASLESDDVSNFLCNTKEGDEVDILGPFGKTLVFPDNLEANNIMVSTLTGIAPFCSNTQRLFVDPNAGVTYNGLVWLISGADNNNSLLYDNEFTQIKNSNSNHFRYQTALSNSVANGIHENGDEIFKLLDGGAYIYFAGLKSMMDGIYEAFQKIADTKGVDWDEMLARLKANNQWRVEVY